MSGRDSKPGLGLVGRPVEFTFHREDRAGTFFGLVRAVRGDRTPSTVTVQRFSNPSGTTHSARYRGERITLRGQEISSLRVFYRKRMIPFHEWVARVLTAGPAGALKEGA